MTAVAPEHAPAKVEQVPATGGGHGAPPAKKEEAEEAVHVNVADAIDAETLALMNTDLAHGLTEAEAATRLETFGRNEIPEKRINPIVKFLLYFWGPIAFLIEAAMIIAGVVEDWLDFAIIGALLLVNALIGFIEEAKAESALDALRNTLALKSKCFRGGQLQEIDSAILVPGDVIILRLGDIVPADCTLMGLNSTGQPTNLPLQIDQSALTGESLPVTKNKGSLCYSSSVVRQGQQVAVVAKTGNRTFIGRAAALIAGTNEMGHFQKIIGQIGNFLVIITVVMVVILLIVGIVYQGKSVLDQLTDCLVITIASIPVGLPTVMSVTMAVGAKQLAKKEVIVKRLTAVEELAGITILCSDKTGTLTKNELSVDEPFLAHGVELKDLLLNAFLASEPGANDPIELTVRAAALKVLFPDVEQKEVTQGAGGHGGATAYSGTDLGFKTLEFLPFDPVRKIVEAKLEDSEGRTFSVAKGAPQRILGMCAHTEGVDHAEMDRAEDAVFSLAKRGLRALGVCRTKYNTVDQWEMVGMISLLDPPRDDSGTTISQAAEYGVSVKMVTGDQQVIAKEVAHRLGMQRCILDSMKLVEAAADPKLAPHLAEVAERADGFAQVIPEHKYRVVELLQERGHLVGMTGDGVNDAPALKKADVGIAVHGCTDAARSASDIVLLSPGLSTIIDGIMTSRAIFQRMRSYALYRIASTIHFLLFFFITLLAFNWSLPAIQIVLICLLNDAATLVIAVDNAKISQMPDKWRLGQLLTMSFIFAFMLMGASFAHLFVANQAFRLPMPGFDSPLLKAGKERVPSAIDTIMYLQISSCPHFVIFSSRVPCYWYQNPPSWIFFIAIIGTQIFAMVISIVGDATGPLQHSGIDRFLEDNYPIRMNGYGDDKRVFHNYGHIDFEDKAFTAKWPQYFPADFEHKNLPKVAAPVGPGWGFAIMGISFVYMCLMDIVKVWVYKRWCFEFTVMLWPMPYRVRELARRKKLKAAQGRARKQWKRIPYVVLKVSAQRIKTRLEKLNISFPNCRWTKLDERWVVDPNRPAEKRMKLAAH